MENDTVLSKIIKDVIEAYPDDANHHLLHFFTKVSKESHDQAFNNDKEIFMECWSRCNLKAKAFGGRVKVNGPSFSRDLVGELIRSSKDASTIIDMVDFYSKNCAIEKADSISSRAVTSTKDILLAALHDSYQLSPNDGSAGDYRLDESVMAQKQRIRGGKRTWMLSDRSIQNQYGSYRPLSLHFLGSPNCIYGQMELKQTKRVSRDDGLDLPQSLNSETLHITGIRIESKRGAAISQQRAWATYHFLCDATAGCGSSSIFPNPAGIDNSPSEISGENEIIFTYESNYVQPISEIFGTHFAAFLRKHPHVILIWCKQLAALMSALLLDDVNVVHKPHRNDLYVRKDGLLALGNIAISKVVGESSEILDAKRISVENFVSSFLSSSLCLSRNHAVDMRSRADVGSDGEETIGIVEGCVINISFANGSRDMLRISLDSSDEHELVRDEGCVSVTISDQSDVAVVSASSHALAVRTVKTGQLLLTATLTSATVSGPCVETSRRLRIMVTRPIPVQSVEIIELISLLEETYSTSSAVFRSARCLQPSEHRPCISAEERLFLSQEWETLSRMRPHHSTGRLHNNGAD